MAVNISAVFWNKPSPFWRSDESHMLISECLWNDKGIPELRNAIRHFVKTVTKYSMQSNDARFYQKYCGVQCERFSPLNQSRRKPQKLKYKCIEDATWSGPTCEPIVCDPPPMIFNDLYTCTDGFNFNSECHLRCDDSPGDGDVEVLLIE